MCRREIVPAAILAGTMIITTSATAAEIAGKSLELYGTLELSLDYSDTDQPGRSGDLTLSSNSSRLGFKGAHAIDPNLTLIWQVEQEVMLDQGSGSWASRNTFAGFQAAKYGRLIFGYYDTPFKTVGNNWDIMGSTVAEWRAILGASAIDGNQLNKRAENAILYSYNIKPALELQAMYSPDGQNSSASNPPDNNKHEVLSLAALFEDGPLALAAAYEHWSKFDGPSGPYGEINAIRLSVVSQTIANARVGAIFENISATSADPIDRSAFGLNGELSRGALIYKAQLLFAADYSGKSKSGATRIGLAVFDKVDKQTTVYTAFGRTDNDKNAKYKGVDGGHGDKVSTGLGGAPMALSAGFIFSF